MTHRQAALIGGGAAVAVAIVIAAVVTIVSRSGEQPQPEPPQVVQQATSTQSDGAPLEPATSTEPEAAEPQPKVITARSYLIEDFASEEILASRESQVQWPLASLTKLMTAVVALETIAPDAPVLIVPVPGGNPSAPGIPVGSTFAMRDVLDVMLVSSSNEAAESLAAHVGRAEFIAAMNAKASKWGLSSTVYTDPSGLSAGNRSSARDIFALAGKIRLTLPQIFASTRQGAVSVYAASSSIPYTASATHQLIRDPGFLGGKTGYTDEARGNLLTIFRIGAREVGFVVLGSEQRFTDTRGLRATLANTQP